MRYLLILSLFVSLCVGCSSLDALVLNLRTEGTVELKTYTLTVLDRATRQVIYHSGAQRIAAKRDLSQDPLHVGLPFEQKGEFLIVVRAANFDSPDLLPQAGVSTPAYFFASIVQIDKTQDIDALLLIVPSEYDLDGDHFPDAKLWPDAFPAAAQMYGDKRFLLDCLDVEPAPGDLTPLRLRSYDVHPLALSICDAKLRPAGVSPTGERLPPEAFDTTCGGSPRACEDADGDGEPENTDCDDHDPRRRHGNPRPRNCCQCQDRASCAVNHEFIADLKLCQPPRCNTSFDYDCSGQDVECFIDEDCDGYSPQDPLASQRDCDDHDARIHPGATKICEPENDADIGKDWACDGNPQGGCVDCDLDGDGFQRDDPTFNCPTKRYRDRFAGRPIVLDCNDNDRGVFPGSTIYQSPLQLYKDNTTDFKGGTIAGALRGMCRNLDLSDRVQDSNCDSQPTRGCPSRACDADGDGFANGNVGCIPLDPRLIDCDDNDPQTFPGAPQYSKDNKDHNCDNKIDTCGTDTDGDGYCVLFDCDDRDPNVHPFAADSCNGKDDDCDGLVDEQNPDSQGNALIESHTVGGSTVKTITSCTDSNVGDCGLKNNQDAYSGRCVCTGIKPNSIINSASRVVCPDGRDDATLSPKCFGATQPKLQTCDADSPHDEDCDGRTDAPDGKNLASVGSGTICGVSVGRCQKGNILACDRSKLNPFSAQVRPTSAQGPVPGFDEKDRFLVCNPQSSVVFPTEELCNGYDDDCDGKLPGQDPSFPVPDAKAEIDVDGDTFLRCTGCSQVDNQASFNKTAFRSCGDCNDTAQNGSKFYPPVPEISYPGAPELCDGLSNQCDPSFSPTAQDGKNECGGGAFAKFPLCCQGPPQCIDPTTNVSHCGGCGMACGVNVANSCVGGQCMCKNDPACDPANPNRHFCQPDVGCVQCRTSDADCVGLPDATTTLCDTGTHVCVQCLADTDCASVPGTICDTTAMRATTSNSKRCILCAVNADCKDPVKGLCATNSDPAKNICTQCLTDVGCAAFNKEVCELHPANPEQNRCIGCRTDVDCRNASLPACHGGGNPDTSLCVPCETSAHCTNSQKPACALDQTDPKKNQCVTCLNNADCKSAAKPACATDPSAPSDPSKNQCVVCLANGDCKDVNKPACATDPAAPSDPTKNQCVVCLVNADCKDSSRPVCVTDSSDPTKNQCVACVQDSDCTNSSKPACAADPSAPSDPSKNKCVVCVDNPDCTDASKPACAVSATDPSQNQCVACLGNPDCTDASKPACSVSLMDPSQNQCVPCLGNADCSDASKPACALSVTNPSQNQCVSCIVSTDCKDAAKPACSVNTMDSSQNQCVPCVLNSDCKDLMNPACAVNSMDPSQNQCVPCVANTDCLDLTKPACAVNGSDPSQNQCVPCMIDMDCTNPLMPFCVTNSTNPTLNQCVQCKKNNDCPMGQQCDGTLFQCG